MMVQNMGAGLPRTQKRCFRARGVQIFAEPPDPSEGANRRLEAPKGNLKWSSGGQKDPLGLPEMPNMEMSHRCHTGVTQKSHRGHLWCLTWRLTCVSLVSHWRLTGAWSRPWRRQGCQGSTKTIKSAAQKGDDGPKHGGRVAQHPKTWFSCKRGANFR